MRFVRALLTVKIHFGVPAFVRCIASRRRFGGSPAVLARARCVRRLLGVVRFSLGLEALHRGPRLALRAIERGACGQSRAPGLIAEEILHTGGTEKNAVTAAVPAVTVSRNPSRDTLAFIQTKAARAAKL